MLHEGMVIRDFLFSGLINDETEIIVRDDDFHVVAHGNWYQDNVLDYMHCIVDAFTCQGDNKIYFDLI